MKELSIEEKASASDKIYIHVRANKELDTTWHGKKITNSDIEYVRKNAFIEKAKEFLWSHIEGSDYHVNYVLNEFEKYMEGE